jgi:hypothetical protein
MLPAAQIESCKNCGLNNGPSRTHLREGALNDNRLAKGLWLLGVRPISNTPAYSRQSSFFRINRRVGSCFRVIHGDLDHRKALVQV